MSKKSFMQGAAVLAVAGLIIKFLGACFRIPLANFIGDEGMGFYQTAYPVYVLFLTLSTAGIPTAISRMVSERTAVENHYGAYRVFRVSFRLLFGIGLVSAIILFAGAGLIVDYVGRPEAVYSMRAIAPALLFVPIMAAYRGYFQGLQDMKPTAASQVVEQFFRVICGLSLAYFLAHDSIKIEAAGASFGATIGAVTGLAGIGYIFAKRKHKLNKKIRRSESIKEFPFEKGKDIIKKILIIAIPITIGASIMPIMNTIDLAIVQRRLVDAGFTAHEANRLYGQLTGLAGPLINFPQVLTQAIAMSLVPAVAAARKVKDYDFLRSNVQWGLRSAMIVGAPSAFGLMALSQAIMLTLYPARPEAALSAAPCLFVMAFGVLFLSTVQTLTGVLQGIGRQMVPVRNLFIGAIAKIIVTYIATGISVINVKGAAAGTVTAYIIASVLNLIAVKRYTGSKFDLKLTWIKPIFSAVIMGIAVFSIHKIFAIFAGNAIATIIAIPAGGIVYLIMILVTGTITVEELQKFPKGDKLVSVLNRFSRK